MKGKTSDGLDRFMSTQGSKRLRQAYKLVLSLSRLYDYDEEIFFKLC